MNIKFDSSELISEKEHLHSGHEAIKSGGANACPICQAFEIVSLKIERDRLKSELETSNMLVKGLEGNLAVCESELEKSEAACAQYRETLIESGCEEVSGVLSSDVGTAFLLRLQKAETACAVMLDAMKSIKQGCPSSSGTHIIAWMRGQADKALSITDFGTEFLARLKELESEKATLYENCKYWVDQHGLEAAKRGEVEHELDLARGSVADQIEKIERERDSYLTALSAARVALEYVHRWWDETGRDEGWHNSIGRHVDGALHQIDAVLTKRKEIMT